MYAERKGSQPDSPKLVLLHGYGSNEQDLFGLADEFDSQWHVVSLRAPYEHPFGGFSWFDLEWAGDQITGMNSEQARSSHQTVADLVQVLKASGSKVILGGFSQGAMMTISVCLGQPDLFDGAMILSGRWPEWTLPTKIANTPVLIQHGIFDPILPIQEADAIFRNLGSGANLTLEKYPMAHGISQASLDGILAWLRTFD